MIKFHYAGVPADGFGWGVCNKNLIRELGKLTELEGTPADVAFVPLANQDFAPISPARGRVNLALTFFESPLGPLAAERAKLFDTVFCGSTWCLERMQEAGITNGKVLIQGVDHSIFKSQPPRKPDGQFRIFSGGKFEYRKGQDLVIAAFTEFSKKHADAHLVCSWFNPWPQLTAQLCSAYGRNSIAEMMSGVRNYVELHKLDQVILSRVMANTDIGLFPNRCEGGTNLVLMEYASVGRKIIANAKTGHADISGAITYEIPATTDENHWAVQEVSDIVSRLELAYENRDTVPHWSQSAYAAGWTWKAAAETIVEEARRLL